MVEASSLRLPATSRSVILALSTDFGNIKASGIGMANSQRHKSDVMR